MAAWPAARYATYGAAGAFTVADLNAIQDQVVRAGPGLGIRSDDFDRNTIAAIVGLSDPLVRYGKINANGSPQRFHNSASYTGVGDKVVGVVVPTDGLILVEYTASLAHGYIPGGALPHPNVTLSVALFVGGVQVKRVDESQAGQLVNHEIVQVYTDNNGIGWVWSAGSGLAWQIGDDFSDGSSSWGPFAASGTIFSGSSLSSEAAPMVVQVPAGTYDVEIKCKVSDANFRVFMDWSRMRVKVISFG